MDDLISRRQAIDALGELATFTEDWSCHTWMYTDDVYNAIKQLPPIQFEIVRCKDCKYAEYIDDVQTLWCTECGQGRTVAPNDFCSYAERRTNG